MYGFLVVGALVSIPFVSPQAQDLTREQVKQIVEEYIQDNPQVILDSVESYGREQQYQETLARQEAIQQHMGWLENNDMLPIAGNPDGDITVVEFFDYNCGYCKKALDDVMTIIAEEDDVKFIFVELPILGRTSELAAKWAVAAKMQDRYLDYHIALMKHRGPLNEISLITAAEKVGLDVDKLKDDAEGEEVAKIVNEKAAKASEMGISGTPAFIIEGQLFGGYIGVERMRAAIEEARAMQSEGEG